MSELKFTRQADEDLNDIWEYIAEDNPVAATEFIHTIEQKCQALADSPYMGVACGDLSPNLRKKPVEDYLIFYRPIKKGVEIIHILHGARKIEDLFQK